MRDKKDNATLDLPGMEGHLPPASPVQAIPAKRQGAPRDQAGAIRQQQLELLEETDASGLPVWRRDEGIDLTGLPVWAAAC